MFSVKVYCFEFVKIFNYVKKTHWWYKNENTHVYLKKEKISPQNCYYFVLQTGWLLINLFIAKTIYDIGKLSYLKIFNYMGCCCCCCCCCFCFNCSCFGLYVLFLLFLIFELNLNKNCYCLCVRFWLYIT